MFKLVPTQVTGKILPRQVVHPAVSAALQIRVPGNPVGWLAIYWIVDLLDLIFSLNKKDLTEAYGLQLTKNRMANLEKENKLSLCFMEFLSAPKLHYKTSC